MKIIKLHELSKFCGLAEETILYFVRQEWIHPLDPLSPTFDDEDLARITLIQELKEEFGVNDEAIPIILHLIDQLNLMQRKLKKDEFIQEQ